MSVVWVGSFKYMYWILCTVIYKLFVYSFNRSMNNNFKMNKLKPRLAVQSKFPTLLLLQYSPHDYKT